MKITFFAVAAGFAFAPLMAQADLTITTKPTKNVSCTDGTCAATAKKAVFNATDLSSMLATTDVSLTGFKGQDIVVAKTFQWAGTHHFAMSSSRGIQINAPVIATGTSGMTLTSNTGGNGGALSFCSKGQLEFWDAASTLNINGIGYTLVADLATLSSDIVANESDNFALADNYDASDDGTYKEAPVGASFFGHFEGLGNTISNLTIHGMHPGAGLALFGDELGTVANIRLTKETIGGKESSLVGGIAAHLTGTVTGSSVSGHLTAGANSTIGGVAGSMSGGTITLSRSSGKIIGKDSDNTGANIAGGLVGLVTGPSPKVLNSSSGASVEGGAGWRVGGLVGQSFGDVETSYASGKVIVGDNGLAGGLIGENFGLLVANTFATGFVGGSTGTIVGGLIGHNAAAVATSYSSGAVSSGSGNAVGGLIGIDSGPSDLTNTYFDTTTSGQSHGVGNDTGYPGVTGLTTAELQAGLPTGFDPTTWAEDPAINSGLPYLLALPPG